VWVGGLPELGTQTHHHVHVRTSNVMNFTTMLSMLEAAQGDREKLVLAALEIVLAGRDPKVRPALEAAAIPHWFDASTLSALLESPAQSAAATLVTLRMLPMVEPLENQREWTVQLDARQALRATLAHEQPERFRSLSERAAQSLTGDEPRTQIERLFHRLVCEPERAAQELRTLHEQWQRRGRTEQMRLLGEALHELVRSDTLVSLARAQTLLCLGWLGESRSSLRERGQYAREALRLLNGLGQEAAEAEAHSQLGRVHQSAGKLADALAEYQACNALVRRLVEKEPMNTGWQHELSVSHHAMADVFQLMGNLTEALAEHHAGRAVLQSLVQLDPKNTDWQRDLAASHNRIGRVLHGQGKLIDALGEYQAYRSISAALVDGDPDNTELRRELSVSLNCVGAVLLGLRKLPEALSEYEGSKTITTRLVDQDPTNADWQRDLSHSFGSVGTVLQAQRKPAEALREYQAGAAILRRLIERDPENVEWQHDLSVALLRVGRVLMATGQHADALQNLEAALAISTRLAELEPDHAQTRKDLEVLQEALKSARGKTETPSSATQTASETNPPPIPISISARHVHLTREHVAVLFGPDHELTPVKELSQPGQFACEERVTLAGPRSSIADVRILGPARSETQVEISRTDERQLGIDAPIRASGDLAGSIGVDLVGPAGTVHLERGAIQAKRHIHMSPADAELYGVQDKDWVMVRVGGDRGLVFDDVQVRVHPDYRLDMHVDTDEANAADLQPGATGTLLRGTVSVRAAPDD
jgi:putative phosphotransacetylase